jgi:hypothetical protein
MRVRASSNGLDARRRLASAFASGRWQARYSRDPILAYLPKTSPNASAVTGRPPRRRRTAVPRGDPFRKAIEHLLHETHRPLSSVKIDAKKLFDTDNRGHENRARHSGLRENDGMRTKVLPPDFVTRFGLLLLRQFEFSNRLFKCKLHRFRGCFQGLRQHVQKLFRSFEITLAQDVYPANAFGNVLVAKAFCKFDARETKRDTTR